MRSQCISRLRSHLLVPDDRDVVLGLAGDDAGRAAGAGVEIDRHPPGVRAVRALAPEVRQLLVLGSCSVSGSRSRRRAWRLDDVAALHREVGLRGGEAGAASGLRDVDARRVAGATPFATRASGKALPPTPSPALPAAQRP